MCDSVVEWTWCCVLDSDMKLLCDHGYLRPKVQVALGAILAVFFMAEGIDDLLSKSPEGVFFGVLFLLSVPGWLFASCYGYRKIKRSEAVSRDGAEGRVDSPAKRSVVRVDAGNRPDQTRTRW